MNQRTLVVLLALSGLAVVVACVLVWQPSTVPTTAADPGRQEAYVATSSTTPVSAPAVTATTAGRGPRPARTTGATSVALDSDPTATPDAAIPAPRQLTLVSNTNETFTVEWQSVPGAERYVVSVNNVPAAATAARQATLPWPSSGGNVLVQVAAQDASGRSSLAAALVIVPPPAPASPTASPSAAPTPAACSASPSASPAGPAETATPTAAASVRPTPTNPTPTSSASANSASATPSGTPSAGGATPDPAGSPSASASSPTPTAVATASTCS